MDAGGNGRGKRKNGNGHPHEEEPALPHAPDHGVWRGEDFQI
jgi:hypothetical protein